MTPGSVAMLLGETTGLRVQTVAPSLGAANVRIQGLRGRYAQLLADGLPLYGAGGDSLSLLQVPPLDLGQVEVIKGAASALYGPAALGGVINLVSRRPQRGRDRGARQRHVAGGPRRHVLAGVARRVDGWSLDAARRLPRPAAAGPRRRRLDRSAGVRARRGAAAASSTNRTPARRCSSPAGLIVEERDGGTEPGARGARRRARSRRTLDTRRADAGAVGRWLLGRGGCSRRAAPYSRNGQRPHVRRRRGARHAAHRVRRGAR